MKRQVSRGLPWAFLVLGGFALFAEACGFPYTFRAYLSANFWGPTRRYAKDLAVGLPKERKNDTPYAGMIRAGSGSMAALRHAYQALHIVVLDNAFYPERLQINRPNTLISGIRDQLRTVTPASAGERQELELLRCKIDLRIGEFKDEKALAAAQECLQIYLRQPRPAAYASEARGWLARTYFLRNNPSAAAKLYVDELTVPASNIPRDTLLESLSFLYRTSDRVARLRQDLPAYFDTPAHALYVSDLITSIDAFKPVSPELAELNTTLITQLEQHKDLFQKGAQSDALALALMRASLRLGNAGATLRYAELIPADSAVRRTAEFSWILGSAHVVREDYAAAETLFVDVVKTTTADSGKPLLAATALIRVYEKLGRPGDQLWAVFKAAALSGTWDSDLDGAEVFGVNMDLGYLLDVQLTDADLRDYVTRFGTSAEIVAEYPRKRTGPEMARYALAVRHARREEYEQAATIYEGLASWPRAQGMRSAAKVLSETRNPALSEQRRLEALYRYGNFLSENGTRVFFNDAVWERIQNWVFLSPESPVPPGMTPEDYRETLARERKLQDEQEEYWRAYQVLDQVVEKAGPTPLGFRAATRALVSLRRISDRFGRHDEIQRSDTRLTNWLMKYGQYPKHWNDE